MRPDRHYPDSRQQAVCIRGYSADIPGCQRIETQQMRKIKYLQIELLEDK